MNLMGIALILAILLFSIIASLDSDGRGEVFTVLDFLYLFGMAILLPLFLVYLLYIGTVETIRKFRGNNE